MNNQKWIISSTVFHKSSIGLVQNYPQIYILALKNVNKMLYRSIIGLISWNKFLELIYTLIKFLLKIH